MFNCGRVGFTIFRHTDIKGVKQRLRGAQRPLTTGIVRQQFLSLRGTKWRNNGRCAWKGSRLEHRAHMWRWLTFMGWNWKFHVIIVIKTDLSGFVVPMHSGLCEQYVKSLGLTSLGFDFLFRTRLQCTGKTNPSRTGLNPLDYIYCFT